MTLLELTGQVGSITFRGQQKELRNIPFCQFDINTAESACLVEMKDGSKIAVSRWSTPKRTRTYPFARIYDTYSHNGKIVTVIPILKDEGKDTNNDRINFITLSWMNLMNIYIILAWYEDADKKSDKRIGNQRLSKHHVSQKIIEISQYRQDAHHWNIQHFQKEFVSIYENAVECYERISQSKGVELHPSEIQRHFLNSIRDARNPNEIDLEKFKELTLKSSKQAAVREVKTQHAREELTEGTTKAFLELRNNLGGNYMLTVDELVFINKDTVILQESKNSSRNKFPSENDIKDGLFKLILYKHITRLSLNNQPLRHSVRLRITGRFRSSLVVPCEETELQNWLLKNKFSKNKQKLVWWLYHESQALDIPVLLEGIE